MMKKGMIKFLATGMTALTLMGTAVAFAPATQVFAAEAETMTDANESTHELKTMYVKEADAYVKELVGNAAPYQEYENTRMYRVGDKVYSISTYDQGIESIYEIIYDYDKAVELYGKLLAAGMVDGDFTKHYDANSHTGPWYDWFDYARITGKIQKVSLSISTYTVKPVESVKITADQTMIRPGQCANLQFHVNDGADEGAVTWRVVGEDGIADFYADGNQAIVTGFETGTVMVVAETEDGVRDFVQINIVDF